VPNIHSLLAISRHIIITAFGNKKPIKQDNSYLIVSSKALKGSDFFGALFEI
jgi:hypothetical protein